MRCWSRTSGGAAQAAPHRQADPRAAAREHDAAVSYSYVAKYVHRRRPQVVAQAAARDAARAGVVAGFVPQCHPPGAEAEVDFADLWVRLAGEMTKCFLFTLRLSHSGRAVHRVFASQGQEAFLEGHVAAFEVFDGVPFDKIRYDNLRSAVHRVLFGRNRAESGRWLSVSGALRVRRVLLPARRRRARTRRVGSRATGAGSAAPIWSRCRRSTRSTSSTPGWSLPTSPRTTGTSTAARCRWVRRSPARRRCCCALPGERFDTALSLTARVDRYAQIMVRQVRYSVPARLIGSRVRVALSASQLQVFDGPARVATHPRVLSRGEAVLELDHYLEILLGKPGCAAGVDRAGPGPRGGEVHRDP